MLNRHVIRGVILISGIQSIPVHADELVDPAMLEIYGPEDLVDLAAGYTQRIELAPSVTSVITASEIEKMGATDIDEILETVPGLHVSVSAGGYNPIYQFRGITSEYNPQVLMLVNGIPITNIFAGNRGQAWGGMPVKNIAKIEVIRGPGSALYGADAFAGVINIITKTAKDIDGLQMGGRYGTFGRGDGWLQYGNAWRDLDVAFSLEFHNTDGADERIDADAQTALDQIFSTSASLAPGSVNLERENLDTRIDVGWRDWRIRAGYQMRNEMGAGAGLAYALDPDGRGDSDRINVDLTYENNHWIDDWGFKAQASYFHTSNRSNLVLFPPGAFGGAFPDGVIASPDVTERHYRFESSASYTGFAGHKMRFGAGLRYEDMYQIHESKNYIIDSASGAFLPLGGVVDVRETNPFIRDHSRTVYYSYLQDEWNFLPDWILTAGLRFDEYSDFGSTVNPRVALVWQTTQKLTTKLLYGRAFRAPSFQEQYNLNNPIALGDDDLDPETINSVELSFDYAWGRGLPWSSNDSDAAFLSGGAGRNNRMKLNVFWYEMDEILRFVPKGPGINQADNTGKQVGHGVEYELALQPFETIGFYGNYAYQHSRDKQSNEDVGYAPTHQVYGRIDWEFFKNWNFQIESNWVTGRKRSATDNRSDVDDYVTVDLTLVGNDIADHWGTTLSIKNLFDEQMLEPSTANSLINGDLPLSGQSLYLELRFDLD